MNAKTITTATASRPTSTPGGRLLSIDALRGLVMLFMLVDHVREIVYAHHAVTDPMKALTIEPALFFTRLTSQLVAPIFIVLAGLSAYLYSQSHTKRETSYFLATRGLFLLFLEFTLVTGAWAAQHFPPTFWLQVIWAIGLCMLALAALLHLPRTWQLVLGTVIVCGHNLLDGIVLTPDSVFHLPWAVLHQRAAFDVGAGVVIKISYPVLPWIGVILLGYAVGPWFARGSDAGARMRKLTILGWTMLLAFLIIRFANVYGDQPWANTGDGLRTVMSFLAATKYPPSLMFLMSTLGIGLILLSYLERVQESKGVRMLALMGGAPMFFYVWHLYLLKILNAIAVAIWGHNQGTGFGFDNVSMIWLTALVLITPLYIPTRWFAALKQRRRDIWWLKYL